jgi:hypothetical protein
MSNNELVQSLRKEAESNKAFGAICHLFAMRERARNVITLVALQNKMKAEGFDFEAAQYEGVLKFLASNGVGKLDYDPKGRLRALKDISVTLQSIGQAAIARRESLQGLKRRHKFSSIFSRKAQERKSGVKELTLKKPPAVQLTVFINDKPVKMQMPTDMSSKEIAALIQGFQRTQTQEAS